MQLVILDVKVWKKIKVPLGIIIFFIKYEQFLQSWNITDCHRSHNICWKEPQKNAYLTLIAAMQALS